MRRKNLAIGALVLALAGCDLTRPPQLAIPQESEPKPSSPGVPAAVPNDAAKLTTADKKPAKQKAKARYHGRTAEQWGHLLQEGHLDQAYKACSALRLMGAEGREQLLLGVESPNPESRRLALEALNVSDFRSHGEKGHQALVRLAGDKDDMRIRQRATSYLMKWNSSAPAR